MKRAKDWKVAVIGAGTMGQSIAQYFATKGLDTKLYNRTQKNLDNAYRVIKNNLKAMEQLNALEKGSDVNKVLKNLTCLTDFERSVSDADIVFECVSEDVELKKTIFEKADLYAPDHAYLCSDTSALNIFEFVKTNRPEKVLITHFFNPPHVMPLVEIVRGENTSDETVSTVKKFLTETGKKPIVIEKCVPGFIFNRLLTALEREAMYIVEQGVATCDDIDTVITTTFGPRFVFEGIFDLLDHVGLDTEVAVVGDLLPHLCQSVDTPRLLKEKAKAGELGIKSGKGFKDYEGKDIDEIRKGRTVNIIKTLRHIDTLGQK
ncbi:MAG TPA: 3-hydroxyacyl-CoA dehydrogenase family protein [Anaerovoracaceae bacterium]|nr:3-hydroxyacyl-CoA dehydrogenase family protein [Anaerovoracaceae bacterium]